MTTKNSWQQTNSKISVHFSALTYMKEACILTHYNIRRRAGLIIANKIMLLKILQ